MNVSVKMILQENARKNANQRIAHLENVPIQEVAAFVFVIIQATPTQTVKIAPKDKFLHLILQKVLYVFVKTLHCQS